MFNDVHKYVLQETTCNQTRLVHPLSYTRKVGTPQSCQRHDEMLQFRRTPDADLADGGRCAGPAGAATCTSLSAGSTRPPPLQWRRHAVQLLLQFRRHTLNFLLQLASKAVNLLLPLRLHHVVHELPWCLLPRLRRIVRELPRVLSLLPSGLSCTLGPAAGSCQFPRKSPCSQPQTGPGKICRPLSRARTGATAVPACAVPPAGLQASKEPCVGAVPLWRCTELPLVAGAAAPGFDLL